MSSPDHEITTVLNVRADVPTKNGRIYTKETLEKAFSEFSDKRPLLLVNGDSYAEGGIDLHKVVGRCVGSPTLREDGSIAATFKVFDKGLYLGLRDKRLGCTITGYGNLNDKNEVENFSLLSANIYAKEDL